MTRSTLGVTRLQVMLSKRIALRAGLVAIGLALLLGRPGAASWLGTSLPEGRSQVRVQTAASEPMSVFTPMPSEREAVSADLRSPEGSAWRVEAEIPTGLAADLPDAEQLATQFGRRAALLRSEKPIAVMSSLRWDRSGKAADFSAAEAGRDILVPLVYRTDDYRSYLAIQNPDTGSPARVQFAFRLPNGEAALEGIERVLPPGGSEVLDLAVEPEFDALGNRFRGGLRLTSDRPIAAVTLIDMLDQDHAMLGYEGIPADRASQRLIAPLLRSNAFGTTGIAFTNPGSRPVDVTLTYRGRAPSRTPACQQRTIVHNGGPVRVPAGASVVFYQGGELPETGESGLPGGCFASGVLEVRGGTGVAVVVDSDQQYGKGAAYIAPSFEQASRRVGIPFFTAFPFNPNDPRMNTGIQIFNAGTSTAIVCFTAWDDAGAHQWDRRDCDDLFSPMGALKIPAGESITYHHQTVTGIRYPDGGFRGSAVLECNQPIVAIVGQFSQAGTVDSAMHNGIPLDGAASERLIPLLLGGARGHRLYLPWLSMNGASRR